MKKLGKILAVFGSAIAIALVLILAAPQTVHGVAAALVQVVNTAANPAITQDTTLQASQIVVLGGYFYNEGYELKQFPLFQYHTDGGQSPFYHVPDGQYLVITSLRISPNPYYCTSSILAGLTPGPTGRFGAFEVPPTPTAIFESHQHMVIGPGIGPEISFVARDGKKCAFYLDISGYLTPK